MKHLIDILDFTTEEIYELIDVANDIIANPENYSQRCKGKILAALFFEPSTRTRLSFESAMYGLGGNVIGFSEAMSSSLTKGESVSDTARIISEYADIIAMRHPKEGAPLVASKKATIPIINAGDGGHFHPTQTLTDLLTIYREKGRLSDFTIGICGDLKFGRTVHSLIAAIARYQGIKFIFISPDELKLPDYVKSEYLTDIPYKEISSLEEALPEVDILYMTRIQRERFEDEEEYMRLKDSYILDMKKMQYAKEDMCILHPLPRVNEISVDVDKDKRACYFRQARYGKFIRMALILKLLESANDGEETPPIEGEKLDMVCKNHRCISSSEQELPNLFQKKDDGYRCVYCDEKI